jgi:DNA repair exonuclease SbcCD ATPase subunit
VKISALRVENFKRIHSVSITPDADRALILIGGKNAAGKSSLLDALTAAFGGKRAQPVDPVRHGADAATIDIELDGGELVVKRIIDASGESVLEVRDRMGAVKAPQAVLDKLVSGRFLDPLQFLSLPAKEQRAQLMKLIDGADRIAGLNEKRERAFARRTDVGRDLTKAEGELARLPKQPVGEPIDVASLTAEVRGLDAHHRGVDTARRTYEQCERETEQARANLATINAQRTRIEAEIERLKGEAIALGIKSAEWAADIVTCEATEAAAKVNYDEAAARAEAAEPRRASIAHEIAKAAEFNKAIAAAEAQNARRADTAAEVDKLTKERDDLTKVIDTIDARKAEILAAAKLPVPELGISDTGIELGGVPFAQASGAERLRVGLALAIAASPGLNDVWIRDGALLDEESLQVVATQAAASGHRVWVERVGTRDPGVITIRDGQVAS